MITVYITYVEDGVEVNTDFHEFDNMDDYEWLAENHWRTTSTTSAEIFERMPLEEKIHIQAIWEEIEEE